MPIHYVWQNNDLTPNPISIRDSAPPPPHHLKKLTEIILSNLTTIPKCIYTEI